jgi:Long-chain acyl-CoA synthetases (AMP-forming)
MAADAGAAFLFVDAAAANALEPVRARLAARLVRLDELESWIGDAKAPRAIDARPEDPFNIIYSSGTTGMPKGIVQPNTMRWAHVGAKRRVRLRPRGDDAHLHAALFEHDPRLVLPDHRPRRHRGADGASSTPRPTSRSPRSIA